MKKIFSLLLLTAITFTAYADRNKKDTVVNQNKQAVTVDTSNQHAAYGERLTDPRLGRYMNVDPSQQKNTNPYQNATSNPVKQ